VPIRVFVYGSLKRGKHNHGLLSDSRQLGRAYIEGQMRLISLGAFPGVVEDQNILHPGKVVGEVYQISDDVLRSLDYLEGHPRFYERRKVETQFGSAWCYFLPSQYLDKYPIVESGMWMPDAEEAEWFNAYRAA
jgi:gamma-glutamylaminecyclotransferase